MDEEKKDENTQEETDPREDETKDEIRDEDYREDDIIEMLREMKAEFAEIKTEMGSMREAFGTFVDNGATIRETEDASDTDDFADDFVPIEEMDLSIK